jgi:hypothetical protein
MGQVLLVVGAAGAAVLLALVVIVPLTMRPGRSVSDSVERQLEAIQPVRLNQHKVTVTLADGRVIKNVYIGWGRYVNYSFGFRRALNPKDIVSVSPAE